MRRSSRWVDYGESHAGVAQTPVTQRVHIADLGRAPKYVPTLETGHARRAIPILEATVGLGHSAGEGAWDTAVRLQRVGMAYFGVGVHANGAAAFGKAIDLMTKEKGPDALELAGPYVNLGNCYKRMQKVADAERCQREALRFYQLANASDDERISTVLLNLGVACAEQGRNEEAERYYLEVLEMRIRVFGKNHWRTGNAYNNLAACRRRLHDFPGAERYIQQAIETLDEDPEHLSSAYDTLSRLREDEGKTEQALASATRAREIQQSLASPDLSEIAALFDREASLATAPPANRDLTNLPESLKLLEQHLAASLERVRALQETI